MRPVDVNGVNKWAGEYYHLLYHDVYGMRTCSLRLTNCYGPRQVTDRHTQGAFPFFIGLALAGKPITLYDEGQFKRDINYVDDVVEALLLAGEHDAAIGEAVQSRQPARLTARVRRDARRGGRRRGSAFIPYPPQRKAIEIGDTYCEYGKISRTLNWLPRTSLRDGLAQTVAWHRAHASERRPRMTATNRAIPIASAAAQYATIKEEMDAAVHRVLESGWFILGDGGARLRAGVRRLLRRRSTPSASATARTR